MRNSSKKIGNYAFANCRDITELNIPAVTAIGKYIFDWNVFNSKALTLTLGTNAPTIGWGSFNGVDGPFAITVKVPAGNSGYNSSWISSLTDNRLGFTVNIVPQ